MKMKILNSNFSLETGDKVKFSKFYIQSLAKSILNGQTMATAPNLDFHDSFVVVYLYVDGALEVEDSNKNSWWVPPIHNNRFIKKADLKIANCKIFEKIK